MEEDPIKHLKWFLLLILGLWLAWFLSGGPEKAQNEKPFIKPLAPLDTGETYGPQ